MTKATFYKWSDLPQTPLTPQISQRLVSGEKVMSVQFTLSKGAVVNQHQHPHEQITHIISGKIEFEIEGQKRVMEAGEVLYIPSNVPHGATVLADTVAIEVFSPPREDFLTGKTPAYMKEK